MYESVWRVQAEGFSLLGPKLVDGRRGEYGGPVVELI